MRPQALLGLSMGLWAMTSAGYAFRHTLPEPIDELTKVSAYAAITATICMVIYQVAREILARIDASARQKAKAEKAIADTMQQILTRVEACADRTEAVAKSQDNRLGVLRGMVIALEGDKQHLHR